MDIHPDHRPGVIRPVEHVMLLSIDQASWTAFERDPDASPIPDACETFELGDIVHNDDRGTVYRRVALMATTTLTDLALWLEENAADLIEPLDPDEIDPPLS